MTNVSDKVREAFALLGRGEVSRAKSILLRAVRQAPADPEANAALAETLTYEGDLRGALFYAQRAVEQKGASARHWTVVGHILCSSGKLEEGVHWLRRSCEAGPEAVSSWEMLVRGHLLREDFDAARDAAREGLARHPTSARLHQALAQALFNQAEADEAFAALRAGLAANPGNIEIESAIAIALLYRDDASEAEVLAAHTAHAASVERALRRQVPQRPEPARWNGEAPLRIGFVSPDLRAHSVAFFVEPLLRNLDRARAHVTCYSTCPKSDEVTARLRPLADVWRDVAAISPLALADRIRTDGIHALVDLCGLMAGHRLTVLAMKPAAVQVNYLGYPGTFGFRSVGVRIVDSATDPAGAERFAVERLERIDPCFLCYQPHPEAPALPGPRDPGPIRFGSFNALQKITAACARLWAGVLEAVPDSRLLLKPGRDTQRGAREALTRRLVAAGIAPERVEYLDRAEGAREHLGQYARVDVALDTYPYHGTTTTCEALWMGVPVVTCVGAGHRSRVGASLLAAVGLSDLVTETTAACSKRAAAIAADPAGLATMRTEGAASLRTRMAASPLCDGPGHAARFLSALERVSHPGR